MASELKTHQRLKPTQILSLLFPVWSCKAGPRESSLNLHTWIVTQRVGPRELVLEAVHRRPPPLHTLLQSLSFTHVRLNMWFQLSGSSASLGESERVSRRTLGTMGTMGSALPQGGHVFIRLLVEEDDVRVRLRERESLVPAGGRSPSYSL
ncbi:unnamed protein product [Pleuronectes platessa]|uniref:Uncharacterized protein n=1 Tax=Pleuronectes platessa TaxID=8262 RepID=A0A9N7Y7D1_PLEPL|nr:unnamed protein product [Pleuronectes platessa]